MPALTELGLKALKSTSTGLVVDSAGAEVRLLSDGQSLFGVPRAGKAGADGKVKITVSFVYKYRFDGKAREISCGSWPRQSLKDIRQKHKQARDILDGGADPATAKKAAKLKKAVEVASEIAGAQAALARPTFAQLFDKWEELSLAKRKDKGAETRRAFEKDVLPVIGKMFAEDIKRPHLLAIFDAILARGAARLANRTLTDLKQLFKWAILRDHLTADPLMGVVKRDVGGKEEESDRVLSTEELRALPAALASAGLPKATANALMLILATGTRVGEIIRARRADFDVDKRLWRIPEANSKNGEPHKIHISDFALPFVENMLADSEGSDWIMPSRVVKDGQPETHVGLKSITKAVGDRQLKFFQREAHAKRTVANANALVLVADAEEAWSPHDLRRSAASIMASLGVPPHVIDKCLNHKEQNRVRRTYQVHDYWPECCEAWRLLGDRLHLLMDADTSNVAVLPTANAA